MASTTCSAVAAGGFSPAWRGLAVSGYGVLCSALDLTGGSGMAPDNLLTIPSDNLVCVGGCTRSNIHRCVCPSWGWLQVRRDVCREFLHPHATASNRSQRQKLFFLLTEGCFKTKGIPHGGPHRVSGSITGANRFRRRQRISFCAPRSQQAPSSPLLVPFAS
jgi:hypothetical protein